MEQTRGAGKEQFVCLIIGTNLLQQGTFLIWISADICRAKDKDEYVVDTVEDKVVQDITGEEWVTSYTTYKESNTKIRHRGTGVWSNQQAVFHHIPAPTLTTAHYLRLASADRNQRIRAQHTIGGPFPPQPLDISDQSKPEFLETLRRATYAAFLASYIQGINIIERADRANHWNVDYAAVLQIWRAGCIIQADHIASLLHPIFANFRALDTINLLFQKTVMADIKPCVAPLRDLVVKATAADHVIPALSATLEYIKYQTSTDLPMSFAEAQLDYFGAHMYDRKGEEGTGAPTEGKHHFEWKPAHSSIA